MFKKASKLKTSSHPKKFLLEPVFLTGLISGYILGIFKIHTFLYIPKIFFDFSWPEWITQRTLDAAFLSDIAAIEAVLIGVSIPIALQVVSWSADKYNDQEIAKFFTEELLYRLQYILLLSNIILVLLLKFLAIKNSLILWIIFLWFVVNVFIFYLFIRLVERYATEIDSLLLNKLNGYVQDILEK